jgi:hypothetical protein
VAAAVVAAAAVPTTDDILSTLSAELDVVDQGEAAVGAHVASGARALVHTFNGNAGPVPTAQSVPLVRLRVWVIVSTLANPWGEAGLIRRVAHVEQLEEVWATKIRACRGLFVVACKSSFDGTENVAP